MGDGRKLIDVPFTVEERKHPHAECERCPLARVGKYVPSKFPTATNPRGIAFVGEAPARTEIRLGEPFVGQSGKLLNVVLRAHEVPRDSVLLTNACSCHYPTTMKELPKEAIDACRPRLLHELQTADITTVVTMGNSATIPLLPKKEAKRGITKLRAGPPKRIRPDGMDKDIDLVPTFHPAYCLRSQAMFPLMLGDVAKAVTKERPMMWYEPNIHVINSNSFIGNYEALELIDTLLELNRDYGVVVDTESGRDKDTSYGRDDGPYGRILCVGVGGLHQDVEHDVFVFTDACLADPSVKAAMANLFNECGIIAQNGKYDIGTLMSFLEQEEPFPLISDTMLDSYALYEVGGIHGLKYMGQEVLSAPDWDSEIKPHISKDQGYATIPRDMLYRYNAYDVHVTRILHGYFSNLINEHGLTSLRNFLLRVSKMLTLVERRGMGFDAGVANELIEKYDFLITEYEDTLPFNPRSPKQVLEWLKEYEIQTDSTDEEHLISIMGDRKTDPAVVDTLGTVLKARGVSKLKGTYVTGPLKKRTGAGRVHTSYLLHGTTTGRLSSRGPNLQNIPRKGDPKRLYVPSPGKVFVQVDFSQAELRVITWLAQEDVLRDLFNDPSKDLFYTLCETMISGFAGMNAEAKKEARTLIKTFAYGVAYGRTAAGVASDSAFNMTIKQAQAQMDVFNAGIPRIKAFQQQVIERIHAGEDLVNPFGRHRRFYLITDANKSNVENEAMAFLPQSTASDICLEAACRLSDDGVRIVNLIHDAILVEADPLEALEVAERMNKVMVDTAAEVTGGYVDFATDYEIGDRWSDLSKSWKP